MQSTRISHSTRPSGYDNKRIDFCSTEAWAQLQAKMPSEIQKHKASAKSRKRKTAPSDEPLNTLNSHFKIRDKKATKTIDNVLFTFPSEEVFSIPDQIKTQMYKLLRKVQIRPDFQSSWKNVFQQGSVVPWIPFFPHTVKYYLNTIWVFGVTQSHQDVNVTASLSLKIQDFYPYFFIKLSFIHNDRDVVLLFKTLCQKNKYFGASSKRPNDKYYGRSYFYSHRGQNRDPCFTVIPTNWPEKTSPLDKDLSNYDVTGLQLEYRRPAIGYHSLEDKQYFKVIRVSCRNDWIRKNLVRFLRQQADFRAYPIFNDQVTPEYQFHMEMLRVRPSLNHLLQSFTNNKLCINGNYANGTEFTILRKKPR